MSTACYAYNSELGTGPYGYVPSFAAGVTFCVLFGSSSLAHVVQSVLKRQGWLLVFAIGAIGKIKLLNPQLGHRQLGGTRLIV